MDSISYELPHGLFTEVLAAECATSCEAFGVCGGSRITAPCRCIWPKSSGKQYQCGDCDVICRERRRVPNSVTGELGEPCFTNHVAAGYSLEQTSIKHEELPRFPLFIPLHTQDFRGGKLPFRWVASDIRWVFNVKRERKSAATLKHFFATAEKTRQYLNVDANCQLLLVLNGEDILLEQFWKMPRQRALSQLASVGFSVGTGPTFSITEKADSKILVPFASHSVMLMRHHRGLAEVQASGMLGAPNLYWLDGDTREIERWAGWLIDNPEIRVVSRDFTSTSHPNIINRKISELIHLLAITGRTFHILIVGTGPANAPAIIIALAQAGHTVSIVTSAPVMKAQSGAKYLLSEAGDLIDEPCDRAASLIAPIIQHNLTAFEDFLFSKIADTPAVQWAFRNTMAALDNPAESR